MADSFKPDKQDSFKPDSFKPDAAPQQAPSIPGAMLKAAYQPVLEGSKRILGRTLETGNPITPLAQAVMHPLDTISSIYHAPGEAYERAVASHKAGDTAGTLIHAAGTIPLVGGMAEQTLQDAREGNYPEAVGDVLGPVLSAKLTPRVVKGIGKGLGNSAEGYLEAGQEVRKRDRLYNANPGKAIRTETTGVTPEKILDQLRGRLGELGDQANAAIAASPDLASLTKPLRVLKSALAEHAAVGAQNVVDRIRPMLSYFQGEAPSGFRGATVPPPEAPQFVGMRQKAAMAPVLGFGTTAQPPDALIPGSNGGFAPRSVKAAPRQMIAPDQPASTFVEMRRKFAPNFNESLFGPGAPTTMKDIGKDVYTAMSDEAKRVVPKLNELDPRMHDIMSAIPGTQSTTLEPSLIQKLHHKTIAHTGALTGMVGGLLAHNPLAAAAGFVVPELIGNPVAQNIAGRGLHYGSRVLESPLAQRGIALAPIVAPRKQKEQQQ